MPETGAMKRLTLMLIVSVVVLDAIMIGGYFALHVSARAIKTQQTYVAVWVVLTLAVVTTMLKRIRALRRRR